MACQDGCYAVNISSCEETIIVTGLEANQPYYYLLTNKFEKVYQRITNADATGKLIVDCSILPPGSMNRFSGPFRLEFRDGNIYTTKIIFSIDDVIYSCIEINLFEIDIADDTDFSNIISLNSVTAPPER